MLFLCYERVLFVYPLSFSYQGTWWTLVAVLLHVRGLNEQDYGGLVLHVGGIGVIILEKKCLGKMDLDFRY